MGLQELSSIIIVIATCISPSPAGPLGNCPLHLLHLCNLSFVIGLAELQNTSCILELRANQCIICNFHRLPRCQCQIAPKKTHCVPLF